MPFAIQLKKIILKHFDDIVAYRERLNGNKNGLFDVQDGIQFKATQSKYSDSFVLSLTVNTDGIQIYNSTSKSLWPIQVYLNFLTPNIRYNTENVIVVALHDGKPNMCDFFYPFLNELKSIKESGGMNIERNGNNINFLPFINFCTADLPAKADLQGLIGHCGRYGCGYCLHAGDLIKKNKASKAVVCFIAKESPLRTHRDNLDTYSKLKSTPINGIKFISCMIAAHDFDLINGFSIDYMHYALLGVVRKLMDLWLNTENHSEQYYIPKRSQVELSKRIICIKPISEISRKPRSIFERKDYKGNEFRTLLLYYLRYALVDLLPIRYINHFQLFSSSIYMLLEKEISHENICTAEIRLNKFVEKFEDFYGKHNDTMNIHLLKHIANSVRNLGPLWARSAFSFETNNGVIVRANQAKKDVLLNLAWKYAAKCDLKMESKISENKINLGGKKIIRTESDIIIAYSSITFRGTKFTSLQSKDISTADYFVQLIPEILVLYIIT